MNKKSKGFTIIELLVVVAIIAVLAAIVLVNVTQYINKGKDAAIKGNMSTILTNGAIHYDSAGNYTAFPLAANPAYNGPAEAIEAANAAPTAWVNGTGSAYCVKAVLKDTTTYCVDSTGFKGALATGKCASATEVTCN